MADHRLAAVTRALARIPLHQRLQIDALGLPLETIAELVGSHTIVDATPDGMISRRAPDRERLISLGFMEASSVVRRTGDNWSLLWPWPESRLLEHAKGQRSLSDDEASVAALDQFLRIAWRIAINLTGVAVAVKNGLTLPDAILLDRIANSPNLYIRFDPEVQDYRRAGVGVMLLCDPWPTDPDPAMLETMRLNGFTYADYERVWYKKLVPKGVEDAR